MYNHGHYQLDIQNNILIAKFIGAWNFEQTTLYAEKVKTLSLPLHDKSWARVVNLSEWEGGGEEVVAPLHQVHLWSLELNCKIIAFVNPPLLPKYMLEKYGDPYGDFEIFKDELTAVAWVTEKLKEFD